MRSIWISIILVSLLVPGRVAAQDEAISKRIAKCAAIEGELERLECYDSVAQELGLVSSTTKVELEGTGKWHIQEDSNPLDDSKTIFLSITADDGKSRMGKYIQLCIRCKSNSTEVYILWNDYLGSDAEVTYRIGNTKAKTSSWSISTNSQATFYPDNDIAFVRSLLDADRFVAQVTPYNESPVTAIFDIRGLSKAITPLKETCGWE